jgi:carboxyl-terminal processing protease
VVLAAAAATSIRQERLAFEKLSPEERHLAIYDAFCAQIKKHYFDQSFSGVDWKQIDEKWREKVKAASSDAELYFNVLQNIGLQFPASHVAVESPAMPVSAKTTQMAKSQELLSLYTAGPGFDSVLIRRGTDTRTVVGDVVAGSAADRAGIEPGWRVLDTTSYFPLDATTGRFAGEFIRLTPDQKLQVERTLEFTYPGVAADQQMAVLAANTIKLEYELVPLPARTAFETKSLPGGGMYIRFDTFGGSHVHFPTFFDSRVVEQVLEALDQAGPDGVVIDLRRNGGGLNHELERLLDRVLKHDSYVGTKHSASGLKDWRTARHGRTYSGPVVVLIGPATASAAEIFAAAIQDNARGRLVGRMTNGSALEAILLPLPDGGEVRVPVSDFVRASGRRIEGEGVEPDVRVVPSLEEIRSGRDPVIERAVLELRNGASSDRAH